METTELVSGVRLGPYELVQRIGAGGMGEVFHARDTRLGRDVAIKILTSVAHDDERRKRFMREARAISALTHPNICALYDIGMDAGHEFLVMEYLDGETLAARLVRGALPIDEALRYAIDIAAALEAAHRKGIFHRDLKPANVMLTSAGAKLLDFGLARLAQGDDVSALTREGHMVGTVEYMSPEQLNGGRADARTDIFAFGVLLYEMLTGNRPFRGDTPGSIVGAILFSEPQPLTASDGEVPAALDHIIAACLKKKPDDRIQTAHDLRLQLQWLADGEGNRAPQIRRARRGRRLPLFIAAAFLAGSGLTALVWMSRRSSPVEHQVRFALQSPVAGAQVDWPVISPDGTKIAFITETTSGERALWVRDLGSTSARQLPGTAGATQPFWSPNNDAIAFFLTDKLELMHLADEKPHAIATAQAPRGGSWSPNGAIIFAPHVNQGLSITDMNGSSVRQLTRLAARDVTHRWPEFLPDGEHFLFVIRSRNLQRTGLYVGSLGGATPKKIATIQSRAVVSPNGWLFFLSDRALYRQRFDLRKLELQGDPMQVASDIAPDVKVTGATRISLSHDGALTFASADEGRSTITLRSRSGSDIETLAPAGYYVNPALSPDGKTLAFSRIDEESGRNSIWLLDLTTKAMTPFVDDDANADGPVWSAAGTSIYYCADRRGPYEVYVRSVGAASADRLVMPSSTFGQPVADTSAGLLCHVARREGGGDYLLWRRNSATAQIMYSDVGGGAGDATRDGKWFAVMSVRTDNTRSGVEVRSLDDTRLRIRVGPDGTSQPTWRPDGRELYYVDASARLIATEFRDGAVGKSRPVFAVDLKQSFYSNRCFVANEDGTRFIVLESVTNAARAPATVVLHWDAQ